MDTEDTNRPISTTLRPPKIEVNDFKYGYNMARIASLEVLDSLPGGASYSTRMGFLAYVSLLNDHFPNIDHIQAAEFAENIGLRGPKS